MNIDIDRWLEMPSDFPKQLKNIMRKVEASPPPECSEFSLDGGATVSILPKKVNLSSDWLVLGGVGHDAEGGFVVANLLEAMKWTIRSKTEKRRRVPKSYDFWWLILINYIAPEIDEDDIAELREILEFRTSWDKIILLDPGTPTRAFDLTY